MTTVAAGELGLAAETTTVPVLTRPAPRIAADDAVTALYLAHYRGLVRLAALLLDDAGAAEEVVQDAYVRMHGSWRRIRDPQAADSAVRGFMLVEWRGEQVIAIRDFRYASYCVASADIRFIDG